MKRIIRLLIISSLTASVLAQSANPVQREEMKKLDFLVGEWKGEGWTVGRDGKRGEFIQTERVQRKAGGLALLIEGQGTDKTTKVVEFEAIALVFYDERAKLYKIYSGTNDGRSGVGDLKLIEGGAQWGPPGAPVRYTIKLTDKGEWFETGEYSRDGTQWQKFLEMKLQKMK